MVVVLLQISLYHHIALESKRTHLPLGWGQRCESSSTLVRSDSLTHHTVLRQQGAFLQMGCYMEPQSCKMLSYLAVPRALGLISLLLVHTYPEEASLSGCQEVHLAQGWREAGCWASSPPTWYLSEVTCQTCARGELSLEW